MQTSVRVVRGAPRPRDRLEGVAGRLLLKLRVCSKRAGDPVDSYLHVGTGAPQLVVDEAWLKKRAAVARTRQQLERLVQELSGRIAIDYSQFATLNNQPVVPGSSVKGNVRARLELSFVPREGAVRSCLIRASEEPLRPPPPGQHGWRHFRLWQRALEFNRGPACDYTNAEESEGVCLLCDIFGTAGLQGLVEFGDLVGAGVQLTPVNLPTGEKLLAAPPGSAFSGSATFKNLRSWELGLLLYGMGLRESRVGRPVLLGKVKYRRYQKYTFGVVRYEVERLELAPFSQPLEAGGVRVEPGRAVEGGELDRLVKDLVSLVRSQLEGELLDVDEVVELERIGG